MITNKYWIKTVRKIVINQTPKEVPILAGSNISKQDATLVADSIAERLQMRIDRGHKSKEYQAEIKEFVSHTVDKKNVITVTRYGAQVWNTTQYTILDLDDYPFEFLDIFGRTRGIPKKTLILERFKKRIDKHQDLGRDFRIYETAKGLRVICNEYISPQNKGFLRLLSKYGVDSLYAYLCQKQDCYRARITPKPYRIKYKTIRITSPLDCETEGYRLWNEGYQQNSKQHSVTKLLETIGYDFSNDSAIVYHDRICNTQAAFPLA